MQSGQEDFSAAVAKLGSALSRHSFRKSFSADPLGTLDREGIDKGQIPQDVLDTLAELSPEELRVLSTVKDSLRKAGITDYGTAEMV